MVSKENQIKFYAEELREIEFKIKKNFCSPARALFQEGLLFVGQFRGIDDKRGNIFVDIPFGEQYHAPRIDQSMNCFTLKVGMMIPSQWGNKTYADLLEKSSRSECKLVDYTPSKRVGWITMILRGMDSFFIDTLEYNQMLALGPTIPPFEYLQNLKEFSATIRMHGKSVWERILNFKIEISIEHPPQLLTEEIDIAEYVINQTDKIGVFIFQGPPGTGKTHQIADVVSRLAKQNNSVLVTALTNKAAIELCEKPFLNELLASDRIAKIPLLLDEQIKFPAINSAKEILPVRGHIMLSTYYQFSKIWASQSQTFDYVIVEEASQSFLTTIAAAAKVGKKVIVVGDPYQIVPIVSNKNYNEIPDIDKLVFGLESICKSNEFLLSRKTETRRLSPRATEYTNYFYQNTIVSKSLFKNLTKEIDKLPYLGKYIHPQGGPSLILLKMQGLSISDSMMSFLINGINDILENTKNKVAVLTPYIDTLTYLQQNLKIKTKSKAFLIDTVDRVQGLDVDYCFYVIPKPSIFSFNLNRFNVATSRSKKATFILTVKDFDKQTAINGEVGTYLTTLQKEFSFEF